MSLQEARKNPDQNPKTSINEIIKKRVKETTNQTGKFKNIFLTLTSVEKVGVNPFPYDDKTPLGIYAYPAEYVLDLIGDNKSLSELPFGGDQPYVNTFSISGTVIDLSDQTNQQDYIKKLIKFIQKHIGDDVVVRKNGVDYDLDQMMEFSLSAKSPLWRFTKLICSSVARKTKLPEHSAWTKMFRALNIDAVIDTTGSIHKNEPTQVIVFNPKSIINVSRFHNKYSPESVNKSVKHGMTHAEETRGVSSHLSTLDTSEILEFLEQNGNKFINSISDPEKRLKVVKLKPELIKAIDMPTTKEIVAVLTRVDSGFEEYLGALPSNVLKNWSSQSEENLNRLVSAFRTTPFMKDSNLVKQTLAAVPVLAEKISLSRDLAQFVVKHSSRFTPFGVSKAKSALELEEMVSIADELATMLSEWN